MQLLQRFFRFYIYSNLHVAIAVFCLTKLTLIDYGIQENITPWFVFFATIVSYNFIRFYNINEVHHKISTWIHSQKTELIILILISLTLLAILFFKIKFTSYIVLIPFLISTFFYSVPFLFKWKNLRSRASLKLFLIAITWAGITVLFPAENNEITFTSEIWIIFLQRLLFIIGITIPFDIRDVDMDNLSIKTLPQIFGVKMSKLIGSIALIIFFILDFVRDLNSGLTILITLVISVISILLLNKSTNRQSEYYSAFLVESIPIIWFLMTVIFI
ncbi:MAG: hypothetical protein L3J34_06440 [Flavobacteriaceae bacterium]|nr:hypothetical protein [Flavobacteriaceae bacterium]